MHGESTGTIIRGLPCVHPEDTKNLAVGLTNTMLCELWRRVAVIRLQLMRLCSVRQLHA